MDGALKLKNLEWIKKVETDWEKRTHWALELRAGTHRASGRRNSAAWKRPEADAWKQLEDACRASSPNFAANRRAVALVPMAGRKTLRAL